METKRRPKILQIFFVAVILITAVVSVPTTNAKYAKSYKYKINIQTKIAYSYVLKLYAKAASPAGALAVQSYTAENDGYYVFIAKGGNGAAGLYESSDNLSNNAGIGGYIYGCVYLQKNDVLNIYVGSSATDPKRANTSWGIITTRHDSSPGQNALNAAEGGNSAHLTTPSTRNSSGAGGAATVILKGSGSSATIIAVAGGAGGGGACDRGIALAGDAHQGGTGGTGGNMNSTKNSSVTNYIIYKGYDGTAPEATVSGNTGSGGNTSNPLTRSGTTWSNGNGSAGSSFGGGGGGGYAGGGGGEGNGYNGKLFVGDNQAGGGGGGSSCIVKSLNSHNTLSLKGTELSKISALNSALSTYTESSREGFVIIAYVKDGVGSENDFAEGAIS